MGFPHFANAKDVETLNWISDVPTVRRQELYALLGCGTLRTFLNFPRITSIL
jgi:hypothetical protein